ncbi:hypothetical protein BO79DRAFT_39832 [Aspergillus costaricaensis CBS 115574]|uniref:Uncharacterized protein n=1 Tax=Aspergillus costaricaensis CBS 115574 TaxID=1448317 RepID=A0ACD1I6S9_9EURO|nr:hypothetical protein BO79DRAFT_39832 [Aspergillus costaricaensis CBS 115574]RAK85922.1 hypothetical protein BO79DRAFT_39832 [Aspergillus costaricaensis CBS 115574]
MYHQPKGLAGQFIVDDLLCYSSTKNSLLCIPPPFQNLRVRARGWDIRSHSGEKQWTQAPRHGIPWN